MGKREKEKAAARAAALGNERPEGEAALTNPSRPQNAIAPGQTAPGRVAVGMTAQLMEAGQFELAESTCRVVLQSSPSDPDALHLLGVLLGQRGEIADAVSTLELAVAAAPENAPAWTNLGIMLTEVAPQRAEECFRAVLAFAPNSVPARGNLAALLEASERFAEAEEQLRAILAQDPRDPAALELLAKVSRRSKQYAGEVDALGALIHLLPGAEHLRGLLGQAYCLWYDSVESDPEMSLEVLTRWLEAVPTDPVARDKLASRSGPGVP